MDGTILGPMMPFVVFFTILVFVTLRGVTCPDCHEHLSGFISPFKKTKRQWLDGGYVCSKCGCEVTMAGAKVPANMPLRFRSYVQILGILSLSIGVSLVLHLIILHR
jgi:hypothetical protein